MQTTEDCFWSAASSRRLVGGGTSPAVESGDKSPHSKRAALRLLFALCALGVSTAHAAEPPRPNAGPVVQLPPMLVEESASGLQWYYINAGNVEILSRCSSSITYDLADAWLKQLQLLRVLVPEEFLVQRQVPSVLVLYAQELEQSVSAEIQKDLQARNATGTEVNLAPSMRLGDRDMDATISYVDQALFNAAGLSITSGHVRHLLRGRVPELPGWLVDGIERNVRRADFVQYPITLGPAVWQGSMETDAFLWDAARPRAVLPASELFATGAARVLESQHVRRIETRESTQELFVRWALLGGAATREALWKFASRAAEVPVTEADFEAAFGFDYSELRDRLSDYLPKAAGETKGIEPGTLPRLPRLVIDHATPNQVARIRGEWERLAIGHVHRRLPEAREPYLAQARRTLHRAYDAGDRDPRLLATMGLVEVDVANDAAARPFLEGAVAGRVVRPRAYYELARIRWAELQQGVPENKAFSFAEIAPVFVLLRRALAQTPPLPEVYSLIAEAWSRCDTAPEAADWPEMEQGVRYFARQAGVAMPTARAYARHGRKAEATAVLDTCTLHTADKDTRTDILRLRAELAGGP